MNKAGIELARQRRTSRGALDWVLLIAGVLAIVQWQRVFYRHRFPEATLASPYVLQASGGIFGWQQDFVYFLYYLNLFPVATVTEQPLEYSREGAQRIFSTQGGSLVMDRYWTIRYGDLLKTYLYLPDAYMKGTVTDRPSRQRPMPQAGFSPSSRSTARYGRRATPTWAPSSSSSSAPTRSRSARCTPATTCSGG